MLRRVHNELWRTGWVLAQREYGFQVAYGFYAGMLCGPRGCFFLSFFLLLATFSIRISKYGEFSDALLLSLTISHSLAPAPPPVFSSLLFFCLLTDHSFVGTAMLRPTDQRTRNGSELVREILIRMMATLRRLLRTRQTKKRRLSDMSTKQ
jgi:hypothetical protein